MSYGDGVVTRERNGTYRVRMPDGHGKHPTIASGIATRAEALQIRAAARLERATLSDSATLRRVGPSWLQAIRDFRSWKQINSTWHSIVLDAPFVDVPLDVLQTVEVQAWADTLPSKLKKRSVLRDGKRETITTNQPISHKSAAHAVSYVKGCLDWAVRAGRAERNACAAVKVPPNRQHIEEPLSVLPAVEVETLLRFKELTLEQRTVFTLAICQCPREGELAGMDWERIDWEGHGWHIVRSWNGPTKTNRSRWQALIDRAFDALRAWWEHCGRPTHGIVFPSSRKDDHGRPKRYARGYDWGWSDHPERNLIRLGMWRRAGLRTRIRFHDTRDTCATHLLSGTWGEPWPVKLVSVHLGHRSVAVTEARYAHTTREALRKAAAGVTFGKAVQTPAARPAAARSAEVLQPHVIAGSGGRDRTYDQSVNRPPAVEELRVVTGDAAGVRQVRAEALAADLLARVQDAGATVPAELLDALQVAGAELAGRMLELAGRMLQGGPGRLDAAIALALLIDTSPAPVQVKGVAPGGTGA